MSAAHDSVSTAPTPRRHPLLLLLVATVVVVIVAVAVGLVLLAGSPRTTSPSAAGRIVVVDGAGLVTTMDDVGGSERAYALTGSPSQFPAWSPDGGRLAVVGDEGAGLFVVEDGAQAPSPDRIPDPIYQSAEAPPFYLYWSPDGRQVTFLTSESEGLALRAAPADGSTPGGIVRRGAPMYWAWTADDRLLVHAGGDGPDAYVGELGLDGSEARRAAVVPGRFQAPAVSSDGLSRAYVISTEEPEPEIRSAVILVEDSRDGSIRRVAVRGPTALGWAPGSQSLAFIAPREDSPLPLGPLQLLDETSTEPHTMLEGDVVAFFWSPDGASIAALALPSDEPRQVASRGRLPTRIDARPTAEANALQLVVLTAVDGTVRIDRAVRLSNTFISQVLPFFDQYALSHRIWSPQGDALVLPLVGADGQAHISIVPLDGGEPRTIADGEIAFWGPDPHDLR